MQMDEGIDTGPVLATRRISIGPEEDAEQLTERMAELAAEVVRTDVQESLAGKLTPTPQDNNIASYAPILTREHARIDWTRSAQAIQNQLRGFYPWPGASSTLRGKTFKILRANVLNEAGVQGPPGTVLEAPRGRLWIACRESVLEVIQGQMEGRKALSAEELLRGRAMQAGDVLGV